MSALAVRNPTNRVILSGSESGTPRLIVSGLTSDASIICENVGGWHETENISHDIRKSTFPTAASAGVHVGSTHTPKGDLSLALVYVSTDQALAHADTMTAWEVADPMWLLVTTGTYARVAGYKVFYSGYSIDDFFNEGCRVTYRFTTPQATPTYY